jgi:acyl transferase domain-containing protein/acyl carrier protein
MTTRTVGELRSLLVALLSARLGIEPGELDVHERFSRYGLSSAGATGLIAELSAELGSPLSPTLAWSFSTVEELACHLAEGSVAAGGEAPARPSPARPPAFEPRAGELIAIVGMACRFPAAPDPAAMWRMLCDGVDATRQVPSDRWDAEAYYHPDPQAPGTINTRRGAFLDRVDLFDPLFFGISPREASEMDPQQRLMLELAWEALEDAGIPPRSLAGTRTGVFAGVIVRDYADLHRACGAPVNQYTGPGTSLSIVANRVSYALGLRGPSLAVDTACSSSLVAVHLACQSLRQGESTLALAGGVNLILSPEFTVELTKFGGLSGDGRCKAFDAGADGFARGEGGGVAALKPLSRALADGDRIYAVIRGGAVNNDGFSNGLTAPNPEAQIEVLAEAYARSGVDPGAVHYVEAHGTGTRLGDPIEARALSSVLCAGRDPQRPLVVGSVKTNIGHQEGAAGIAGLLKLALALWHRAIPPSLHFARPNPDIPFDEWRLSVQTSLGPWEGPALGGVSSFGWGGTNCHLVLEGVPESGAQLLALSAGSAGELCELARRYRDRAAGMPAGAPSLLALCTAGAREPENREHRLAVTARSRRELAEGLDAFLAGRRPLGLAAGRAGTARRRLVFVLSGMGAQWPGMARDLLRAEPLLRARLERADRTLLPLVGWSVVEELAGGELRSDVERVLPSLLCLQIALADLWRSWGVEPDAVVGHSFGEIAAAYVAGALTLEEAVTVGVHYSRALGKIAGGGDMGVVALPPEEALARAAEDGRLEVAGWLAPSSAVVAGETAAVESFLSRAAAEGRFTALVSPRGIAAHTVQVEPHQAALREALAGLSPRRGSLPLVSTITGGPLDGRLMGAEYWAESLRRPVLFSHAVDHLLAAGHDLFLSVDPHPILATPLEQCFAGRGIAASVLPSLRRGEEGRAVLLDSLGALWAAGQPVRRERVWPAADGEERAELFPLSARSPEALADLARATASHLRQAGSPLRDACHAAATRRSHHEHRLGLVAPSLSALAERLEAFARGETPAGATVGRRVRGERGRPVFVFSGQGPQWAGMGRRLLAEEPVYREIVERCDELSRSDLGGSFLERIAGDERALEHTEIAQPALFALQAGLAALWRSWGVIPGAVVGHSIGEVAAAFAAGALTLEEGARVAAVRGRAMAPAHGGGRMVAVELPEEEVLQALAGSAGRIDVAAVNGPAATVIAGDPAAIEEAVARLRGRGAACRPLRVEYAFHSPGMEPFDRRVEEDLAALRPRPVEIPMISTVTGAAVSGPDLDAAYWRRNVRQPVRFADAMAALEGHAVFLEIGPHPVLAVAVAQCLERTGGEAAVLASLRRGRDERETLLETLGALYATGHPVDWRGVHPDGGRFAALPTYPFQRQRYWIEGAVRGPAMPQMPLTPQIPQPPAAAEQSLADPEGVVERLLAEQLDAFNRMVSLQLQALAAGAEPEASRP